MFMGACPQFCKCEVNWLSTNGGKEELVSSRIPIELYMRIIGLAFQHSAALGWEV